jgi:predicted nucleic acid-binding protein
MIALFDTDVVLDLFLDRQPFAEAAAIMFSKVEEGEIQGYVSATTITTVYYLAAKTIGVRKAKWATRKLLTLLKVASVDRSVIEGALEGKFKDFEDGVIAEAAGQIKATVILTRNVKGFKTSAVPAHSPAEMLKILKAVK